MSEHQPMNLAASVMQVDRETPARRESCRTRSTGRQTWKDLLFVHWEVPAEALARLLPAPLSIDTFEGEPEIVVPEQLDSGDAGSSPVPSTTEAAWAQCVITP